MTVASLLTILTWVLVVLGPVAAFTGRLALPVASALCAAGCIASAACLGLLIAGRRRGKKLDPELTFGALGLPLVLVAVGAVRFAYPIAEASTDADDPPRFEKLSPEDPANQTNPFSPELRARLKRAYPDLQSREIEYKPIKVLGKLGLQIRTTNGWQIETNDYQRLRLEGVAQSPFGFPIQFSLRVRPGKHGSVVDMRARVVGVVSDFGESSRLVEGFMEDLHEAWICRPAASKSK